MVTLDDPPARLRVLLQTAEGIDAIALLTRLQGTGDQATYRCEGLATGWSTAARERSHGRRPFVALYWE